MLEAIIAFFPVKEDHDAIGSIDYPLQVRSKLATNSQKWSCEVCGLITGTLPEQKNKVVSTVPEKSAAEAEANINKDEGDNISDVSSIGRQRSDSSPDSRLIKKAKHKKIDLDRRSHLSHPIEAVIIEDVNEYEDEDFDEESRDNNSLGKKDKIMKTNTMISELVENMPESDIPKQESSGNDQPDFMQYLRQLRLTQFDNQESSKDNNNIKEKEDKIIIEEEQEIRLKTPFSENRETIQNDHFLLQKTPFIEHVDNVENTLHNKQGSMFKAQIDEEVEFYKILKSVKAHNSVSIEDITKEIFGDKIQDFLNSEQSKILKEFTKSMTPADKVKLSSTDKDEQNKAVIQALEILNQKDKLENMLKQKNNALKYYVRRRYKETKQFRLRTINIIMFVLIVIIFSCYYLVSNGWTKSLITLIS